MRRKLATSVIAMLTVLVSAVGIEAAPAQASPGCFTDRVCLWDGENYSGDVVSITIQPVGVCVAVPSWMDNRASSIFNNSPYYLMWFDAPNCNYYINTAWPWLEAPTMPAGTSNTYTSFRRI